MCSKLSWQLDFWKVIRLLSSNFTKGFIHRWLTLKWMTNEEAECTWEKSVMRMLLKDVSCPCAPLFSPCFLAPWSELPLHHDVLSHLRSRTSRTKTLQTMHWGKSFLFCLCQESHHCQEWWAQNTATQEHRTRQARTHQPRVHWRSPAILHCTHFLLSHPPPQLWSFVKSVQYLMSGII